MNATLAADNDSLNATSPAEDDVHYGVTSNQLDISYGQVYAVVIVASLALACFVMSFACKSRKVHRHRLGLGPSSATAEEDELWTQDLAAVERGTRAALELERHMTTLWWNLYMNRPWRKKPGPDVSVKETSPNAEWLGHEVFPNGETRRESVTLMVFSLWCFLWGKRKFSARRCVLLQMLEGLCPAAAAQLLARIIHYLNVQTFLHEHEASDTWMLALLAVFYLFVNVVKDRIHWHYEVEVPGASVRQEMRQRLQRELLEMHGSRASGWPVGRCAALLECDVRQMVVYGWMSLFDLVRETTNSLALTGVMLYQTRASAGAQITCLSILVIIFAGAVANVRVRRPNVVDLAIRKRNWKFTWLTVACKQIHRSHELRRTDDAGPASTLLGNAAMVYRKRAFHYYFIHLMSSLSNTELILVAQAAVIVVLGREALHHRVNVSGVVGVISVMNSLKTNLAEHMQTWLNMVQGYASLLSIADVFNGNQDLDARGILHEGTGSSPDEGEWTDY